MPRGCGSFSLIGTEGRQAGVYPLRCRSWRCPSCSRRKTRATAARIAGGIRRGETRWFTLTSPAGEDFTTSYDRFQERWHRVLQRIRRKVGDIEFVAVIEPQRRGAAHVHVVYRGRPIPKTWLSQAAAGVGFGRIVDVGTSVDVGVAGYLTKSLAVEIRDPSLAPPPYFHRVRWSRGWGDAVRTWKPRPWAAWHLVAARPALAASSAIARGYEIVELVGADPPDGCDRRPFHRVVPRPALVPWPSPRGGIGEGPKVSPTESGVTDHDAPPSAGPSQPDPLLLALARYVQALDRRYPGGPAEMRRARVDFRANMPAVLHPKDPAA